MNSKNHRKVIRKGKEVDILSYDREMSTTFNSYTEEDFVLYKTLMRHVGGIKVVAFELFKHENGYTDSSKRKVIVKNKETEETEELLIPVKETFFSREGIGIRTSYEYKVGLALNYNHKQKSKSTNNTALIISLIDKLAEKRQKQKDKANLNVSRWLISKDDPIKQRFTEKEFAPIKKTLNSLNSGNEY